MYVIHGRESRTRNQSFGQLFPLTATGVVEIRWRVRDEWGLMVLCHNLGRVLSIIGLARFIAALAASPHGASTQTRSSSPEQSDGPGSYARRSLSESALP